MANKKKKTKKAPQKKKSASETPNNQTRTNELWVDQLDFLPIDGIARAQPNKTRIRIVSWNILAESYLTRRSHPHLPRVYQKSVFSPPARRALLTKRLLQLHQLDVDVLCLQEVDLPLDILEQCGYKSVLTPTCKEGNGTGGRVDACGIYVQSNKFQLCDYELVRLDDLATLGQTCPISNLQGLATSFLRRNVAILCRLRHLVTKQCIVVANAHVYWNPEYEYVKLCQVHYVIQRAHNFCKPGEGVVFCGDLNSPSHSLVHEYLCKGVVNAKRVAPWYRQSLQEDDDDAFLVNGDSIPITEDVEEQLAKLAISAEQHDSKQDEESPQIRYMLDYTLNRFTRWLRILGIDAALETEEEEKQRTKENNIILFERCQKEKRTLVTTSYKLLLRKDCPSGTYLVNPKSLNNLEAAFVHLLLHHGVTLEPAKFLTRCVVCNGNIQTVESLNDKRRVFAANNAPDLSEELSDVYECFGCGQGYWWCDRPSSSATRVKAQATRLFELCLRGGVPIKGPLSMFDFVDVEQQREKGLEEDSIELEHLDVTDWLKNERLTCPIPLESGYALRDDNDKIVGESLPFTNVTYGFVGALDYVLFDTGHFCATERLYAPTSFKELNGRDISNGQLLPSADWPSDHLAIGVQLEFLSDATEENGYMPSELKENAVAANIVKETDKTANPPTDDGSQYCGTTGGNCSISLSIPAPLPTAHPPRCACGCVPNNIKSIFEMAELRKQARLKAAAAKSNES